MMNLLLSSAAFRLSLRLSCRWYPLLFAVFITTKTSAFSITFSFSISIKCPAGLPLSEIARPGRQLFLLSSSPGIFHPTWPAPSLSPVIAIFQQPIQNMYFLFLLCPVRFRADLLLSLQILPPILMSDKRVKHIYILIYFTGKFLALTAILRLLVLQAASCYFAGLVSFSSSASRAMPSQPQGTQSAIQSAQRKCQVWSCKILQKVSSWFSAWNMRS